MSESAQAETTLKSVDPREAQEMIENGAIAIDVRMDYEWDAGHIAGARRVEMNDLVAVAESLPRGNPIVFYCRSGNRSSLPATLFREAGFDAFNVDGGLIAWIETGLPIEPADGEVVEVRPR